MIESIKKDLRRIVVTKGQAVVVDIFHRKILKRDTGAQDI
jgi:hypothetical protein